jgi:hypothetical protein
VSEINKNQVVERSFYELSDLVHEFDLWCEAGEFYWHRVMDGGMIAGSREGEMVEMVGLSYLDTLKALRSKMVAIVKHSDCELKSE